MTQRIICLAVLLVCFMPHFSKAQSPLENQAYTSSSNTSVTALDEARIRGITNTILTYPSKTPQILSGYVGIDTAHIDFEKFMTIVQSGDYQKIHDEVSMLYNNRRAFNEGLLSNLSYYQVAAPAPIELAPIMPTAIMPVGVTSLSTVGFYGGIGLLAAGAAVAASGGGGSSGDNGTTPDPVNIGGDVFNRSDLPDIYNPNGFVDLEFTSYPLNALTKENVQYAYAKGLTGSGVKIGFHDSFTSDSSTDPELSARIVYRNLNIPADTSFQASSCAADPTNPYACNHGGAVMGFAANARNGSGSQGIAYQASLLMNSLFATGTSRVLADNGANIINFSCGGCATFADLQYIANLGVLMTSSTGNSGGANPDSSTPASVASLFDYKLIAVTGIYNGTGTPSAAPYDKCGTMKEYCMAAYSDSGTSFSSPQIAGAAALIKQGWNYLTAKQIGQILLYSAQDIGDPGVDAIFGHGLLDLKAAVEPIGSLTVLNGNAAQINFAPSVISLNQKTAFGDAFSNSQNAKANLVVIDSFGRDFNVKAQDNLIVAKQQNLSPETINSFGINTNNYKSVKLNNQFSMKFSEQKNINDGGNIAGFADYDVTPDAKLILGFSNDMSAISSNKIQKFNSANFIATDVFKNGFLNFSNNNQVYYQAIELASNRHVKTKVSSYYSKNSGIDYFKPVDNQITSDYVSSMVENTISPYQNLDIDLKNGLTHEFNSVLGTKFSGSFDMQDGANTYFTGLDVSYDISPKWNLFGSYLLGTTQASPGANSAFNNISNIISDSFSVSAARSDLLGHDKLGFSIGQPTRVRSGMATGLTQNVDHATGDIHVVGYEQNLAPSGRTLMFQTAYQKDLSDNINMNLAFEYTQQPYQQKNMGPEASTLAKITYRFN